MQARRVPVSPLTCGPEPLTCGPEPLTCGPEHEPAEEREPNRLTDSDREQREQNRTEPVRVGATMPNPGQPLEQQHLRAASGRDPPVRWERTIW